ncbi:hypothetical protein HDV06_002409 [Boothiomyces sp. JEL0866]|nr:hypothetical protein HDV06_002409 [Boothiomyces sp. JEL0866]
MVNYLTKHKKLFSNEQSLIRYFLKNPPNWIRKTPRLVAQDWWVIPGRSQHGVGDLVYTSRNKKLYLVLEFKWLDFQKIGNTASCRRTKKRRLVVQQAQKYANIWQNKHPDSIVRWAAVTNEKVVFGKAQK